jgi:hypothetical protein
METCWNKNLNIKKIRNSIKLTKNQKEMGKTSPEMVTRGCPSYTSLGVPGNTSWTGSGTRMEFRRRPDLNTKTPTDDWGS